MCNLTQIFNSFSPFGKDTTSSLVMHFNTEIDTKYATTAITIAQIEAILPLEIILLKNALLKKAVAPQIKAAVRGFKIVTNTLGTTRECFIRQKMSAIAI